MEMDSGGFFVGAVTGAMVGTAVTASNAIADSTRRVAQRHRDLGVIGKWQAALDKQVRLTEMALRSARALRQENQMLREALTIAELEIQALRNAS